MTSPDADERWSAARAAAALDGAEVELARVLAVEDDPRVREAMLTSLAHIGTPMALEPLILMLRSDSAAHRTAALDALRLHTDLRAVAEQLLHDTDPDVRILSCELARSLPATQSNPLLGELLDRDSSANVCAAAIDVLAEVGEPQVLVSLASCARRFPANQFLVFAISMVVDRINATFPNAHG